MKDSEFIELLNLYLDHEISPADAARLEAEVAAKPARRRIYEDYCRMQKACKALAADFATAGVGEAETASEKSAASDCRNIVAFESARPQRRVGFYGAGALLAAAACVAVIFVTRKAESVLPAGAAAQGQATVAVAPVATSPGATVVVPTVPVTLPAPAMDSALRVADAGAGQFVVTKASMTSQPKANKGLTLASNPNAASEALLLAAEQNTAQFDWIHNVKLEPVQRVQIDQFRFDSRAPRTSETEPGSPRGAQQGTMFESAAFKMTK